MNSKPLRLVSALINANGIKPGGGGEFGENNIETECHACKRKQTLAEARPYLQGNDTIYECASGGHTLLIVSDTESRAWEGRGYALKGGGIRNPSTLLLLHPRIPQVEPVSLPACPDALKAN